MEQGMPRAVVGQIQMHEFYMRAFFAASNWAICESARIRECQTNEPRFIHVELGTCAGDVAMLAWIRIGGNPGSLPQPDFGFCFPVASSESHRGLVIGP